MKNNPTRLVDPLGLAGKDDSEEKKKEKEAKKVSQSGKALSEKYDKTSKKVKEIKANAKKEKEKIKKDADRKKQEATNKYNDDVVTDLKKPFSPDAGSAAWDAFNVGRSTFQSLWKSVGIAATLGAAGTAYFIAEGHRFR